MSLIDMYIPLVPVRSGTPWAVKTLTALARGRSKAWHEFKRVRRAEGRNSAVAPERLDAYGELNRNYKNFAMDSRKN